MTMAAALAARRSWGRAAFVVLMLALTAVFVILGLWQWQRLAEKEALIATVADRMDRAPVSFPAPGFWPTLDADFYDYRPLVLTGRYVPGDTVLVFTSLAEARGRQSGPGYWVMTPFALEGGGSIFINRGFVPQASGPAFATGDDLDSGTLTVTGIGRRPEATGSFTPGADAANRIEWVRDPARLARFAETAPTPIAPIYLDLPASTDPDALPQGGETVVEFPNNHLGYALTWFGFALLTPILLLFWLRRPPKP
jgi:surfeit locus 1 family protein